MDLESGLGEVWDTLVLVLLFLNELLLGLLVTFGPGKSSILGVLSVEGQTALGFVCNGRFPNSENLIRCDLGVQDSSEDNVLTLLHSLVSLVGEGEVSFTEESNGFSSLAESEKGIFVLWV